MRGAILGSGAVHLLVLVGLFYVQPAASLVVPGPETVQVALVDPAALMPKVAPPQETPPPEPAPPAVKPVEDTGVKLTPEPRRKRKPAPSREEAPPAPVALPSALVGPAGLRGDLAVDAANFEFTYYLLQLRNRIAANWTPPAGLVTGGRRVRSVVYFRVARDGSVGSVRLEASSDLEFFDRSALRAVLISTPLPPLPLGFGGPELGVHFGFEWESP